MQKISRSIEFLSLNCTGKKHTSQNIEKANKNRDIDGKKVVK